MLICLARLRVQHVANAFIPEVRDATMRDFDDDCALMKKDVLTPEQVAAKWAAYIGLEMKTEDKKIGQ